MKEHLLHRSCFWIRQNDYARDQFKGVSLRHTFPNALRKFWLFTKRSSSNDGTEWWTHTRTGM